MYYPSKNNEAYVYGLQPLVYIQQFLFGIELLMCVV